MKKFISKHIWLILLNVIFIVVLASNFPMGKSLLGWDSLSPELNIPLNISRAIHPFWQENYGVGTLTGHGFAATLPHTLFIGALSHIFPEWSLRSIFTFFCLYSGGMGMYFLSQYILKRFSHLKSLDVTSFMPIISFIGALYYMFNVGTIQIFYIQLEAFIAQFASLPWLFLTLFLALDNNKKRYFVWFFIVSFLASLQGFIPSLYATYFVSLFITLFVYFLNNRTKVGFAKSLGLLMLTIFSNAYWALPVAYFQLTRGQGFLNSFNNLSSTPHFIELSTNYGNLSNVSLLKSYLFSSYQLNSFILQPWISHYQNFLTPLFGYLLFTAIIGALAFSFLKLKTYHSLSFGFIFLFLFSGLAISTPPFSWISHLLQKISPTYEQAFRTTFTKFGVEMSFLYAVELIIAIFLITILLAKLKKKLAVYAFYGLTILSLMYYIFPVFTGNLIYKKLTLNVPTAYKELTSYMNTQPNGRIADFPQYCNDGWYTYNWGYIGSGFLWYGIEQPFLSRSFDVWSNSNENYFWELSQALNQKDYAKARSVLNKYQVNWIVFDPNVNSCESKKGVETNTEFLSFLQQNGSFALEKTFTTGLIKPIWTLRNTTLSSKNFITLQNNVKSVGPTTTWLDSDVASTDYYSDSLPDAFYPFRSLLTKRGDEASKPDVTVNNDNIVVKTTIPQGLAGYEISSKYSELEKFASVNFYFDKDKSATPTAHLDMDLTTVHLDDKLLVGSRPRLTIGTAVKPIPSNADVYINGQKIVKDGNKYKSAFILSSNNTIEVVADNNLLFKWESQNDPAYLKTTDTKYINKLPAYGKGILTISLPITSEGKYFGVRATDIQSILPEPCNEVTPTNRNVFEITSSTQNPYLRLKSTNSTQCIKLHFPNLIANQTYVMSVVTRNVSGKLPKTTLYNNKNVIYSDLGTGKKKELYEATYVIPSSTTTEIGYDFEFENTSKSSEESINDFYSVSLYPIPYDYIKNIAFVRTPQNSSTPQNVTAITTHEDITSYSVIPEKDAQLLTLSQGFDPGWKAYTFDANNSKFKNALYKAFPFIFGREIKTHVVVNNWENGWKLPSNNAGSRIIITYLPQYLEYLAFLLLGVILFPIFVWLYAYIIFPYASKADEFLNEKADNLKQLVQLRFQQS